MLRRYLRLGGGDETYRIQEPSQLCSCCCKEVEVAKASQHVLSRTLIFLQGESPKLLLGWAVRAGFRSRYVCA